MTKEIMFLWFKKGDITMDLCYFAKKILKTNFMCNVILTLAKY